MSKMKPKCDLEEKQYIEVDGYLLHPNMLTRNVLGLSPSTLFELQEKGYYFTPKANMRTTKTRGLKITPVDISQYQKDK